LDVNPDVKCYASYASGVANACAFFISGAFLVLWAGHLTTLQRLKGTVIDKDVLDDPTWAKLLQLETIRTAMFSAKDKA